MTTKFLRRSTRILVVNPNSSRAMTHGMEEALSAMDISDKTELYTYTAPPSSPSSINTGEDVLRSSEVVYENLTASRGDLRTYDAVLVACFSVHPLVHKLAHEQGSHGLLSVIGIFEASILTALSLLGTSPASSKPATPRTWGIVTTGKFWEKHLADGVKTFLGQRDLESSNVKFGGVESTGLDAGDFHSGVDPAVTREKLKEATKRLLGTGVVDCVVMGCAGMAGLEEIIRDAAIEKYGKEEGDRLFIIDGVKAGVGLLEQMVRNKRMFQKH